MKDLFGVEIREVYVKPKPKGGYAAPPGSGPHGETCKSCEHAVRVCGGRKHFYKCAKIGSRNWTHGPGTDIKLKSPACRFWSLFKLTVFKTATV